jgi:hypothetical protein
MPIAARWKRALPEGDRDWSAARFDNGLCPAGFVRGSAPISSGHKIDHKSSHSLRVNGSPSNLRTTFNNSHVVASFAAMAVKLDFSPIFLHIQSQTSFTVKTVSYRELLAA